MAHSLPFTVNLMQRETPTHTSGSVSGFLRHLKGPDANEVGNRSSTHWRCGGKRGGISGEKRPREKGAEGVGSVPACRLNGQVWQKEKVGKRRRRKELEQVRFASTKLTLPHLLVFISSCSLLSPCLLIHVCLL